MHTGSRVKSWPRRVAALAVATALAIPVAAGTSAAASSPLFAPYQTYPAGADTEAVAIGDVTGDGRADVVVTGNNGFADYRLYVLAGLPDGELAEPVSYPTAATGTYPLQTVAVADMTDDGRGDVVVGASGFGIQVFPQLDTGLLGAPALYETPDSYKVRVGNFDTDPGLDLAAIGWGTNTVSVFLNDGQGTLRTPVAYAAQHGGYDDLEVGDVVHDGLDDIVVMSGQTYAVPNISILPQVSGGGFGSVAEYRVADSVNTNGIGVGDVTGDGRADVVTSYGGNQPLAHVAVFAQTMAGSLDAPVSYGSYDIPTPVEVADLDRDGHLDVVTLHSGWLRAGVYRGQVGGTLAPEELYPLPRISTYDPHGLAVGDITGDGWPDLAIADPFTGLVVLRNYGSTPPPPSPSPSPSPVSSPSSSPTSTPESSPSPSIGTPPGAPTLTSAVAGDGRVSLSWTQPTSEGSSPITSYTATASPDGASCTVSAFECAISGLANGVTYTFVVRATNAWGTGPPSNALTATPFQLPSAPANLTTAPNLAAGVGLQWQAPSSAGTGGITGYRIYRSTDGSLWGPLATIGDVLNFVDTTVPPGATFYYSVAALNTYGEGPRSSVSVAQRATPPGTPFGLGARSGKSSITLSWLQPTSDGDSPITGYRIYRGTSPGGESFLVAVGDGAKMFTDADVARKVRYYYRVTAVNVIGESGLSTEVSAIPR